MGIGSSQKSVTELWKPVINKETGKPYTGLEQCASLERLEQEDKPLSDLLDQELNKWMDADQEAHEKDLQNFKTGFKYKHADGYTYKIIQFKDGTYQLSRSKFSGGAGGGYRRGGTSYIHLRTQAVKQCRVEQLVQTINDQQEGDNYEIIQLQPDQQGDRFLLLNKKPYTPGTEGATTSGNKETETKDEESAETETEQ